jgi:hypothetical protein
MLVLGHIAVSIPARRAAFTEGHFQRRGRGDWLGLVDLAYCQKRDLVCSNWLESVHD